MKRVLLFVALTVVVSGGCRKKSSDDGPYSGGGNPTPEGAAQAVRKSVEQVVTAAELHDLHLMMNTMKLSSGKVPTSQETWEALNRADGNPKLRKMIQDGLIVLVPNPQEEGLWAYDKNAPTTGGWVLMHSEPRRVTAQEFAALSRQ